MTISNCVALEPFGRLAYARDRLLEVDLGAVHADPLAPGRDVGRDGRADGEPLGQKQLLDRDGRGRLAVRADDVNRGVRALRIAERGEQRAHAVEPEAVARPGAHPVEPFDRAGHAASVAPSARLERFLSA